MSTRIRNGRAVQAGLSRTYDLLIAAKTGSTTLGRSMQASWMARHAAALIDAADLRGEEPPQHPLAEGWNALIDAGREIRRNGQRNPDYDYEFELWILPLSPRRTLMIVQAEQREFIAWLDGLPFVDDHSYWDDTDRPDGVAAAAWRRREREWDTVLPNGVPAERCVTMTMFNHEQPSVPSPREAIRHIAGKDERAARHARTHHIDETYAKLVAAERERDPEFAPSGFGLFFKAEEASREDAARRSQILADVTARLRDIGAADLAPRG